MSSRLIGREAVESRGIRSQYSQPICKSVLHSHHHKSQRGNLQSQTNNQQRQNGTGNPILGRSPKDSQLRRGGWAAAFQEVSSE
mmetsp:Transcript_22648/g.47236  ORF Transcript_22648/g.47236 Transcript_22648/m.47236 type:complete len:84 (+) Transcript_22648:88-339(+)